MAITAPSKLSDFSGFITPEISEPIFENARRSSVLQQLVPRTRLGFKGQSIPVTTGRPTANWVGEGERKPATKGSKALKNIVPKKLAAILVDSREVVRADPGGYVSGAKDDLAEAFGIAFDYAGFHDLGGDGTGTGPFDTYIDQTTKSVELGGNSQANGGIWKDLVDGMAEVVTDKDATNRRYKVTGFALDDVMEPRLLGSVDSTGRPLWVDLPANEQSNAIARPGSLMGRRSFMGEGVANPTDSIVAYAGDWNQARWGVVGGIEYRFSTEGTVTINGELVSLFENNLVALLAEAEYGFLVNDVDAFVQYRNDTGS